jgi:hypothetical protein
MSQETWIKQRHRDHLGIPDECIAHFSEFPVGHMHGVMNLFSNLGPLLPPGKHAIPVQDVSNDEFDILATRCGPLLVVNIYRHIAKGKLIKRVLENLMGELSDQLADHEGPVLLGGDFNARHHQELLLELMESMGLRPVLPEGGEPLPTHDQGGVLDWIFVRGLEADPLEIQPTTLSDHHILRTTIHLPVVMEEVQETSRFNWKTANTAEDEDLQMEMDEAIAKAQSMTEFREAVLRILHRRLGPAKSRRRAVPKAWFSLEVRKALKKKRRADKQHARQKTQESKERMKEAHQTFRKTIRRWKRHADVDIARRVEERYTSIYRLVPPKKGPGHQRRLAPDTDKVLDFWRKFFDHPQPLTEEDHEYDTDDDDDDDDEGGDKSATRPVIVFTMEDLREAIQKSKMNKAPGEDDIRPVIFKNASDHMLMHLARLYTLMANQTGPLPAWMKDGLAKILYKNKGPRKEPGNYRVIVMSSIFSKLFEKLLEIRGRRMVEDGTFDICVEQGGFMPGRTTHDSVFIIESLRDAAIRKRKNLLAVFLDLSKAFDTVDHRKFLKLMREHKLPEEWIMLVQKMMTNRTMKLYNVLVSLKVGSPQGSPISPLIFIMFVDPLIKRLRACTGVQFMKAQDNTDEESRIRSLFFADDICLTAETFEDLDKMLTICHDWAAEWGMTFNAGKSQIVRLAGAKHSPVVLLGGKKVEWVQQYTYLGITIAEGRRCRLPIPDGKMWKSYFRVKNALNPRLPLPIQRQLQLIQTDILSQALYPTAIRDMDYAAIDRFVNRILCRITGCSQRWTSATFLRAELGLSSCKFLAHRRALSYLWHVRRESWFRNQLDDLVGTGPLSRLTSIAQLYDIDTTRIEEMSRGAWKSMVKEAVTKGAAEALNIELAKKNLPATEVGLQCRPYVKLGGALARSGVRFRWSILRHQHSNQTSFGDSQPGEGGGIAEAQDCDICGNVHGPRPRSMGDTLRCVGFMPTQHMKCREDVYRAVRTEIKGRDRKTFPTYVQQYIETISWKNQSSAVTKKVLKLFERLLQVEDRANRKREKKREAACLKLRDMFQKAIEGRRCFIKNDTRDRILPTRRLWGTC